MNVLIVSPAPPNRLNRIRLQNIIKSLSPDHNITVYSLNTGDVNGSTNKYVVEVNKTRIRSYLDAFTRSYQLKPYEVTYCTSENLKTLIGNTAHIFDVIIVKRLRALQFLPNRIFTPVIIDSTDAMSLYYDLAKRDVPFWKKPLYYEEWIKYKWFEKESAKKFRNWVVASQTDADYLKSTLQKNTMVSIIPNVVDISHFKSTKLPEKNTIMFSGLLNKHVNQSAIYYFLNKIWPKIISKVPDTNLLIVGPNPPRKLQRINDININVTGEVADIRDYIEKSKVIVSPILIGTGTRNKILQAWSYERPVVSTATGASGLSYTSGKDILIADDPKPYAKNVVSILKNLDLANKLSKNGRLLVEKQYSLDTMRRRYNNLIESVVSKNAHPKERKNKVYSFYH